eukprot:9325790-Alexandrium_andersonii.AAC.1
MTSAGEGTRSGGRATNGTGSCKAATRPASIRFWAASLSNELPSASAAGLSVRPSDRMRWPRPTARALSPTLGGRMPRAA